jgi:hypothetical protein
MGRPAHRCLFTREAAYPIYQTALRALWLGGFYILLEGLV